MELYRPLDTDEFRAVEESGFKKFPARTGKQPLFTVLLSEEGASRIASRMRTDRTMENKSYVVSFTVDDAYISQFPVHGSDEADADALWIPAEEMTIFNEHLVGDIRLRASYEISRGDTFFA